MAAATDIKDALGKLNPFKAKTPGTPAPAQQPKPAPAQQPVPDQKAQQNNGQQKNAPKLDRIQNGNVTLVTLSPEEALMEVQEEREKITFGQDRMHKVMAWFAQFWSLIGPVLFAAGTVGEVYIVLWERQKDKTPFIGFTIVIASVLAEGCLLAISFASKIIRNTAHKRQGGYTKEEKQDLGKMKTVWYLLAALVAGTQVAFIMAQTDSTDIGFWGLLTLALVRAAAALVADYYTAFLAPHKQTSAEDALERQEQQIEFTDKYLTGKSKEIDTLNAGAIKTQDSALHARINQEKQETKAAIEMDNLKTEKALMAIQNEHKLERAKTAIEMEAEWSKLQIDAMRNVQERLNAMTRQLISGEEDENQRRMRTTLSTLINEVAEMRKTVDSTAKQLPEPDKNTGDL